MNRASACIILGGSTLVVSTAVSAYMGPALGLGVIGTILAVVAVSLLSLVAFVVLPIRRMIRKSKQKSTDSDSDIERYSQAPLLTADVVLPTVFCLHYGQLRPYRLLPVAIIGIRRSEPRQGFAS